MAEYRKHSSWLVVADAGPAPPPRLEKNWGPIVYAWLVHRGATDVMPRAAGATYAKRLSTNRGEFMAVLSGLKCLREGLEVHGEWENGPAIVLSDSLLLVDVMTGKWEPRLMRPYRDAIQHEAEQLQAITGAPVRYVHANDGETNGAHKLVNLYARALAAS